jgi:predicted Zn-dependent protease
MSTAFAVTVGMRLGQVRLLRYAVGAAAFACLLGAFPGAVSHNGEIPKERGAVVVSSGKGDFMSAEQREERRVLDANGGVYEDPQLEALVAQIVERLAASSDRPDLRYRVVILNTPVVNAFSLPSGRLYVTRGLLALANDASELAAVLSHEIGHVSARHTLVREAAVRQTPSDPGSPQFGALAFAGSGFALAGFSHSQELEADSIGARIMARAGYDPFGAVRFLNAMSRNAQLRPSGQADPSARYAGTPPAHPATADRSAALKVNVRQYAAPGTGERDGEIFLANIDGLIYGEDPSGGAVRGRQFLNPRLGFAFTAPAGFSLYRSARALLGVRAGGGEMLCLDTVAVPAEQSLTDYLASGWMQNLDIRSIVATSVNGLAAATASAEGSQWSFRILVVRLDKSTVRLILAAKPGAGELDRVFADLAGTFHPMSSSEVAATKPLRLRIVTVQPGDTSEKLARRMAVAERPLERFLVLNGLSTGQALKVGGQVKIVTNDGHIGRR